MEYGKKKKSNKDGKNVKSKKEAGFPFIIIDLFT